MSYEPGDEALDARYEGIGRELYPEHKNQAIVEFSTEKLRSYYVANSMVMRPAVDGIQQGNRLKVDKHAAAALIFYGNGFELKFDRHLPQRVICASGAGFGRGGGFRGLISPSP